VFAIGENVVIENQEQLEQLLKAGDKPLQLKVVLNQVGFSSIKTIGAALRLLLGQNGESDAMTIDEMAFPKALEMG
jgi:hypothetical protein